MIAALTGKKVMLFFGGFYDPKNTISSEGSLIMDKVTERVLFLFALITQLPSLRFS